MLSVAVVLLVRTAIANWLLAFGVAVRIIGPMPATDRVLSGNDYLQQTQRPLNCLLFLLPMLLFFHLGLVLFKDPNQLLAVQHITRLMHFFVNSTTGFLPAFAVVGVLLIWHVARKDPWAVRPRVLAGMAGESVGWMLPLIALVVLVGKMGLAAANADQGGTMQRLLLSVGAGIYEEFIFRLMFIGGAILLLVKVFGLRREAIALAAVAASGVCFSLYHFDAHQLLSLQAFPWSDFVFRALAGAYLGMLYLYRGYAIAVGAHAAWDIYVFHVV